MMNASVYTSSTMTEFTHACIYVKPIGIIALIIMTITPQFSLCCWIKLHEFRRIRFLSGGKTTPHRRSQTMLCFRHWTMFWTKRLGWWWWWSSLEDSLPRPLLIFSSLSHTCMCIIFGVEEFQALGYNINSFQSMKPKQPNCFLRWKCKKTKTVQESRWGSGAPLISYLFPWTWFYGGITAAACASKGNQ